jgi:hypothetical protein
VQDDLEPACALGLRRKLERHPAGLDALLGATDALRDRGFRHEKRARDLGRGEATDRAERQRDLRRGGEGGMRGQEEQGQHVVFGRGVLVVGRLDELVGRR